MKARTLRSVASAVRGTLQLSRGQDPDTFVRRVVVDSRSSGPGSVFVALPGERTDGHAFVRDALARGAVGAIVRRGALGSLPDTSMERLILVDDPGEALALLARAERATLPDRVIGITGSTGKTCTKDFTAAVLSRRMRVVASTASHNNEIGLPLTILRATEETDALVCEMGSRGPGHIRHLCHIALPRVGVVTNVGVAHMELFGSPEVLRGAKAELPESLPEDGIAVLNADDPVVRGFVHRTAARSILFGAGRDADVRAEEISLDRESGAARFVLTTSDGRIPVTLPVSGEHMVWNALAAAATGWALGLPLQEVAQGLAAARISGGRMDVLETIDGVRVVDDTYNANPTSMAAALRAARWMAGDRRCVAILGPMAELGPGSGEEHARIGELVARLGVDHLVLIGPEAAPIGAGAIREGVEPERVTLAQSPDHAAAEAKALTGRGDLILVKGSRVARLERVVQALVSSSLVGTGT